MLSFDRVIEMPASVRATTKPAEPLAVCFISLLFWATGGIYPAGGSHLLDNDLCSLTNYARSEYLSIDIHCT